MGGSILTQLKSKIVHAKIFCQRGMVYASIFNSGAILFILLNDTTLDVKKYYIPLLIVGLFMFIIIGIIEDKLGVFRHEITVHQRRNELLTRVDMNISKLLKKKFKE